MANRTSWKAALLAVRMVMLTSTGWAAQAGRFHLEEATIA
jgi:hypothetical protein